MGAFASKPAPAFDLRRTQLLCSLKIECESGLAREWLHRLSQADTAGSAKPRNRHNSPRLANASRRPSSINSLQYPASNSR